MRRLLAHTAAALLMAGAMTTYGTALADSTKADSSNSKQDNSALPTDLDGGIRLAQTQRDEGKLQEAAHTLTQLMLFAPDDPRVLGAYGKVMVLENRPQDAEAFLRRAIQIQGSDWTFYSALGVAYDEMGDRKTAKLAYERALTLKPGEPAILNNYALSRLAAGDAASARQIMAQAQAADGKDATIAQNASLVNAARPAPAQVAKAAVATSTAARPTAEVPVAKAAVAIPAATKPAAEAPVVKAAASMPVQPTAAPALRPTAPAQKNIEVATLPKVDALPATNAMDSTAATGAPRVLNKDVVMQAVPVDPLAGPKRTKHQAKSKAPTPSLRMSADAS